MRFCFALFCRSSHRYSLMSISLFAFVFRIKLCIVIRTITHTDTQTPSSFSHWMWKVASNMNGNFSIWLNCVFAFGCVWHMTFLPFAHRESVMQKSVSCLEKIVLYCTNTCVCVCVYGQSEWARERERATLAMFCILCFFGCTHFIYYFCFISCSPNACVAHQHSLSLRLRCDERVSKPSYQHNNPHTAAENDEYEMK